MTIARSGAALLGPVAGVIWLTAMVPAHAQEYPARPVRIIVPLAPGGMADQLSRVVAQKVTPTAKQPVLVENRTGGGGIIGAEAAAKTAPDGYTLFAGFHATQAILPHLTKLPYDPVKDFDPVILMATIPNVLVVHPTVPAKSVKELVALARLRRGDLTYASQGVGSSGHIAGELFRLTIKADIVHVPYKGAAPALQDLIGGHVMMLFEAGEVSVHDFDTSRPRIRFRRNGEAVELQCDFIAGCDGFHGVCRPSIPAGALTVFERVYPFGWLGILVEAATPEQETVYAWHERGFGFFNRRSPALTRHFLQVAPDEDIENWPDDRIWSELRVRLATDDGWKLVQGPVLNKNITEMRSFVVEPMRYGRLYLAGDAAHIVPPTGAKGLNLAVADVRVLAPALAAFFASGRIEFLDAYSATCLKRVWRVEHFSWWMTSMLHRFPDDDVFQQRLQRSQLDYVVNSRAAGATLAENYVGLPWNDKG